MAVVTNSKSQHPQVSPRPLITPIALGLSIAPAEAAPAEAEEAGLRAGLRIAQLQALSEAASSQGVDGDLASYINSLRVEADKTNLRLLTAYLKVGKQTRALELVGNLHQSKSIEGALKIANHFHMPQLAERITSFLEDKIQYEQEQEQLQQQQVGVWPTSEVPSQQLSQADLENVQPTDGDQGANNGYDARAKPLQTSSKVAAAGQKRKTTDVVVGLASEPKANPFARKKVVK
eukprot:GHUV01048510.1.p1 GENE.GHUV01048510.1~~GHUV01048510.1.p1  ORF type:complete len:234 (+),score=57.64 GHUV01048510.1:661-1362(+)